MEVLKLPDDIWNEILDFISDPAELARLERVCKYFLFHFNYLVFYKEGRKFKALASKNSRWEKFYDFHALIQETNSTAGSWNVNPEFRKLTAVNTNKNEVAKDPSGFKKEVAKLYSRTLIKRQEIIKYFRVLNEKVTAGR